MADEESKLIKAIVLSIFDSKGPTPKVYWPRDLKESSRLIIAMKSISLLMSDSIYQNGAGNKELSYFGILPFPDLKLYALTYFFLIKDEKARGNAKASTITILIDESNISFFHENMKHLRPILEKRAILVQKSKTYEENRKIINNLKEELLEFTKELKDPLFSRRKIKILLLGLDKAGKTSFHLGVQKKYSEIITTLPTKGVERSDEKLFDEQSSQISIWDLGGQKKYREKFLEQSKIYLYNVDLLFFFIDIQDTLRIDETIKLFANIINKLKNLKEFPPVIVCLHKFDPDLKQNKEIVENSKNLTNKIQEHSDKFFVKIFKTSIFDHWSLISAYSFGLSQLSPNRELFANLLKNLAKQVDSDVILLLNEKGIILSNYSKDDVSEKAFEISAPHFQNLYETFKEFKLLKKDFIVSSGMTDESKKVIFKKILVDKYNLYLLLFLEERHKIEKVDRYLPEFTKKLSVLIKTYI